MAGISMRYLREFDIEVDPEPVQIVWGHDLKSYRYTRSPKARIRMAVRAKVTCESIIDNAVTFRTVYEPDATKDTENVRFTTATPWGEIRLRIDNPAALEQFAIGHEYYVDFTPAEKSAET